ncbi:MAG: restriction endonuclease subunit R [Chloroflexi bacterium HGW-Chloroflexi-3]|nr:MAG: restriction endonuclease subunit R [Chloroflexi bacterium HGW-Chloroflexi-3]
MDKEAKARIKINKLLEEAGWRLLNNEHGKANVLLENHVKLTSKSLDEMGEDFEKTSTGFIDFLLLDANGYPFVVLEAKAEDKNPLIGKEQARTYAHAQNCRFVILSNGNIHYLWDVKFGNPKRITVFPRQAELQGFQAFKPNPDVLVREIVQDDYIVLTQKPDYQRDPTWQSNKTRGDFIATNNLRFLRPYQLKAVQAVQEAVREKKDRFLFEMATGTGKTLVSAAIIKLFLRTGNARRVLFLVDRLELEDQAWKAFTQYLKPDYQTVIYKQSRDDWRKAEIVISTVQTFLSNNRYKREFSPSDFDLVISDEAHRSIGGNARAVFEYFMGYKLGLTATPKDYLKNIDGTHPHMDVREFERRALLDTYQTFGCENGIPTYRYSLLDGVKEGYLINPLVVDARTDITTQLLSDEGYSIVVETEEGEEQTEIFMHRDFERRFFSENTNAVFCKTFLEHALSDPISGEIGKSIIFCVSQNHAAKIAQILNEMAHQLFPGKYNSDFAVQVTSLIPGAQQMTLNFASNKLNGYGNVIPAYRTSKTRVAVTVGMMTTGYDCQDILNLCLMRPIFSPTDFIQIKGRGIRTYDFSKEVADPAWKTELGKVPKQRFKLFDFFANCEYFEEKFNYDQVLKLPSEKTVGAEGGEPAPVYADYESTRADRIAKFTINEVGPNGMKVDRMYFQKFADQVTNDPQVLEKVKAGAFEDAAAYVSKHHLNQPKEFFNLEKLRKSVNTDRRVSMREMLEYLFGLIPYIKNKEELLDEEFDKFDSRYMPDESTWSYARQVFKAYILDAEFREIVDTRKFANLNVNPHGDAFHKITPDLRKLIPEYIKDYVPLNQFL